MREPTKTTFITVFNLFQEARNIAESGRIITTNVPVVNIAQDVMILMREKSIRRAIGRDGALKI